jgi:hypothetical protein
MWPLTPGVNQRMGNLLQHQRSMHWAALPESWRNWAWLTSCGRSHKSCEKERGGVCKVILCDVMWYGIIIATQSSATAENKSWTRKRKFWKMPGMCGIFIILMIENLTDHLLLFHSYSYRRYMCVIDIYSLPHFVVLYVNDCVQFCNIASMQTKNTWPYSSYNQIVLFAPDCFHWNPFTTRIWIWKFVFVLVCNKLGTKVFSFFFGEYFCFIPSEIMFLALYSWLERSWSNFRAQFFPRLLSVHRQNEVHHTLVLLVQTSKICDL